MRRIKIIGSLGFISPLISESTLELLKSLNEIDFVIIDSDIGDSGNYSECVVLGKNKNFPKEIKKYQDLSPQGSEYLGPIKRRWRPGTNKSMR